MRRVPSWLVWANLALLAVLVYMVADGLPSILQWKAEQEKKPAARPLFFDWVDPAKGLQLIQFYASPGVIERGESASLCYGVAQAAKVRIEPPVGNLWPSLNRCVSVSPKQDTHYKLTVEDSNGKTLEAALEIRVVAVGTIHPVEIVGPPLAISYFRELGATRDGPALIYSVEFSTTGADMISIEPPVFPAGHIIMGKFYIRVEKTATYTLKAQAGSAVVTKAITLKGPEE